MIQCLRIIATELIQFLAQLENFQKRLWLKKKFVVSSHYCITLDRVPEEFYPEIVKNDLQWEQWKRLGVWGGLSTRSIEELKNGKYRMVDTSLFVDGFKHRLLASIDAVDEKLDGVLINADNFQGLSFLQGSFSQKCSGIYIDPPYNTDASPIVYKNGYQHSSWASLFADRMKLAQDLLKPDSSICVAIDDFEYPQQYLIMEGALGFRHSATAVIRSKPQGGQLLRVFLLTMSTPYFGQRWKNRLLDAFPELARKQTAIRTPMRREYILGLTSGSRERIPTALIEKVILPGLCSR